MKFDTTVIHAGEKPCLLPGGSGDVVVPIHLASTFARSEVDVPTGGYEYSRSGNPTRHVLENRLAALEGCRHGLAFSSGLGAETTVLLSLLKSGDHIVAFDDMYGGTARLLTALCRSMKLEVTYVDARDTAAVKEAFRQTTRLVWLETPTNPLLKICDIGTISAMARKRGIITLVDNTFMSPYFQNPIGLGAEISLHSTSKYLNGHSDSIGGAVMTDNPEIHQKIAFHQNALGAIMSPFDSFLVLRGIRTLAVRMRAHQLNALKVATYLEGHSRVARVIYPGLASYPQAPLANSQMSGFGGMVSIELDGEIEEAERFVAGLTYFYLAESLGGVESLIELPAKMTHASIPKERRDSIGIRDSLVRISVGIEDPDDLIDDIERSMKKAFS